MDLFFDSMIDNSIANMFMFLPHLTKPYENDPYYYQLNGKDESVCYCIINPQGNKVDPKTIKCYNKNFIVFCHGNACNLFESIPIVTLMAKHTQSYILIFDYPGYGLSKGSANQGSACRAIEKIIDLTKLLGIVDNLILCGQSIGTGIAAHGCKYRCKKYNNSINGLILISPYLSIKKLACEFSVFGSLIFDCLNTEENIKYLTSKLIIIHGLSDQVIPCKHGKILYENVNCEKYCYWGNFGHNLNYEEFLNIFNFINLHC